MRSMQGSKEKESGIKIRSLSHINDEQWEKAKKRWMEKDAPEEGLDAFVYERMSFDQENSFAAFGDNGEIKALLLGNSNKEGFELSALSAVGDDTKETSGLLIDHLAYTAVRNMDPDSYIVFRPGCGVTTELMEHVSGRAVITLGELAVYSYLP